MSIFQDLSCKMLAVNKMNVLMPILYPFGYRVFLLYPSVGTEIIFLEKPSPGTEFSFQGLLFGTDIFLWYSCFPGGELKLRPPLSTVQGKFIYIIFKAENLEIQFPLLYIKPSIDKHKFLSFKCWQSRGRFIGQLCLACTISSAYLSANRAT